MAPNCLRQIASMQYSLPTAASATAQRASFRGSGDGLVGAPPPELRRAFADYSVPRLRRRPPIALITALQLGADFGAGRGRRGSRSSSDTPPFRHQLGSLFTNEGQTAPDRGYGCPQMSANAPRGCLTTWPPGGSIPCLAAPFPVKRYASSSLGRFVPN